MLTSAMQKQATASNRLESVRHLTINSTHLLINDVTEIHPSSLCRRNAVSHYSEQILLNLTPATPRSLLAQYFKVIDDHLYMPLQRAYRATAQYDLDAPRLQPVQRLVPVCSAIATKIVTTVSHLYPEYLSRTGHLSDSDIQISSVRDTEMFQVYLWVCVLESNMNAVQQELFPLCVMLYPHLKVRWELVRHLIKLLGAEIRFHLDPPQAALLDPYYAALWAMFSPQVLPD